MGGLVGEVMRRVNETLGPIREMVDWTVQKEGKPSEKPKGWIDTMKGILMKTEGEIERIEMKNEETEVIVMMKETVKNTVIEEEIGEGKFMKKRIMIDHPREDEEKITLMEDEQRVQMKIIMKIVELKR